MLTSGEFGYISDYLLYLTLFASLLIHTRVFFLFTAKKKQSRGRLIAGNALNFVCMLAFVALMAETYLRFVSTRTEAFGLTLPARRWFTRHVTFNSLGFRDPEWSPFKAPGVRRIAFVGDSFAYGWGIKKISHRFPDLVEAMFRQTASGGTEVLNVAKPGWDTRDELEAIKEVIPRYKVDEIVLCYVGNDVEKTLPIRTDFNPIMPPRCQLINLRSSPLMEYLYTRVYAPRFVASVRNYHDWLSSGYTHRLYWYEHQENLEAVIAHCRDADVQLRVVLLPFLRVGGDKYKQDAVHAQLRAFFEARDVPVVDLLPAVEHLAARELVVNRHDPHPNELAQRLFAERIWQAWYAASDSSGVLRDSGTGID